MNAKQFTLFSMIMVVLCFSSACTAIQPAVPLTSTSTPIPPTPTSTLIPPTPTSTPIPPTPTSGPPTPIPESGIGIPVGNGGWQISLNGIRTADSLKMGTFQNQTTVTPKDGYALLIVDMAIISLDPTRPMKISLDDVAILDTNNNIHTADGGGWGESSMCTGCVISISRDIGESATSITALILSGNNISFQFGSVSSEEPISFVFIVKSGELDQEWRLQFHDIPLISFKLGDKAVYPLITEVVAQISPLPMECEIDNIQAAQSKNGLIFQEWADGRLITNFASPDGSAPEELCTDFAYETLQVAPDGGILMKTGPLQGWANLYFIEPDGRVMSLVRNALAVSGDFVPGNKYAVVSVTQVGEEGDELYLYDRERGLMILLYEGEYINYRIFPNGNLLINGALLESSERFEYMGSVGADELHIPEFPEGVRSSAITSDGEHLLYSDNKDGTNYLFISNLDGSEKEEILSGDVPSGDKILSPDGKYLLMQKKGMKQASLYDLTTGSSQSVTPESNGLEYGFSPNGKWVIAISTFKRDDNDEAKTEKQTLYLFSMDNKSVVKEIQGEIVNYYFSSDNAFLAYTIKNEDETLSIYALNLKDISERPIAQGLLLGWGAAR